MGEVNAVMDNLGFAFYYEKFCFKSNLFRPTSGNTANAINLYRALFFASSLAANQFLNTKQI